MLGTHESENEATGSLDSLNYSQDQTDPQAQLEESPNKEEAPSEPLDSAPDSPTGRTADA